MLRPGTPLHRLELVPPLPPALEVFGAQRISISAGHREHWELCIAEGTRLTQRTKFLPQVREANLIT
jgi:hypothetical protein